MHVFVFAAFTSSAGAFLFFLVLSCVTFSSASLVNVTFDDTFGDERTGALPVYTNAEFGSAWMTNVDCEENVTRLCVTAIVDTSPVFNTSWHATWDPANISLTFNGSAVYTYFITPGYVMLQDGVVGSNLSFFLDGALVDSFEYVPRVGDLAKEVLAYANFSLPDTLHELTIQANPRALHNEANLTAIAFFDRVVYSAGTADSYTLNSNRNLLIGCIIGSVTVVAFALILYICALRRRAKLKSKFHIEPYDGVWGRMEMEPRMRFSLSLPLRSPRYSRTPAYALTHIAHLSQEKRRELLTVAVPRPLPVSTGLGQSKENIATDRLATAACASEVEPLGLASDLDVECESDAELPAYEALPPVVSAIRRGSGACDWIAWRGSVGFRWVKRMSCELLGVGAGGGRLGVTK